MEQNIGELIQIALLGTNMQQRPVAEKQLQFLMEQNPSEFLIQCGQIISNEKMNGMLRQAAGTLIKKMTTLNDQKISSWSIIPQQTQDLVKELLLQTLISKDRAAQKSAAMAIAQICTNEFPQNKWQDLIPLLANNLNVQDIEIKKAAILTLGFICEQLKIFNQVSFLEKEKIENILMGILLGMKNDETNEEVILLAIKALQASLQFMNHLFDDDNNRNYMLNLLVPLCQHEKKSIKIQAMQCTMDIIKQIYQHLQPYINIFFQNLSPLCLDKDFEISVPAIEIWNTLACEDLEKRDFKKSHNHINQCQKQLVQILLQNLLLPNEDDDDDDEDSQNTKNSSYKCLLNVVEVVGDDVLPNFMPFIGNTINNSDNLYKQASVMAFSALISGPAQQTIVPIINQSLTNIIALIQEENIAVKRWTSLTISRIAEVFPNIIYGHFDIILPILLQYLNSKPQVSKNICQTFFNLGQNLNEIPKTHLLFQNFEKIIESLMTISFVQNQDAQLIDQSYMACVNLIKNQKEPQVCLHFLMKLITVFQQLPQSLSSDQKQQIKRGLSTVMHGCFYGMQDIQDQNLINQIYEMVIEEFKLIRDVSDDGLYIIIGLVERAKTQFTQYLPQFYNYLKHALDKINEKDVFKAALNLLLQFVQYCPQNFENSFKEIFSALLNCLSLNDFDKYLKIDIIQLIGDVSLQQPQFIIPFFDQIIQMINLTMKGSFKYQNSTDEDIIEYSDQLKEVLIQTYTCLLDSINDFPQKQNMLQQIPYIIEYIRLTCDNNLNPTVDYSRICLALVSDIARYYGPSVSQLVKQQFVQDIIQSLDKFNHITENQEIIQYAVREISRLK